MAKVRKRIQITLLAAALLFNGCQSENSLFNNLPSNDYLTHNVVIVIIDGPRYEETWGDNLRRNIPVQNNLSQEGVFFRNFYNEGNTYTISGHAAITTGHYQYVKNNGTQLPDNPSIFQAYLSHTKLPPDQAYFISGKNKLSAICDTKDMDWQGSYLPSYNIDDRDDSLTFKTALNVLETKKPSLTIIQFRGPDYYGHRNDKENYIRSIRSTDEYVGMIWNYLQSNDYYKNSTALLVTNDHGRHSEGVSTGFKDHGDRCEGCKHISLLALGPDFKKGVVVDAVYGQTDISPTVAELLGFPWTSEGEMIKELISD